MHPEIRLPYQGKCPLCAMDLIPVAEGGRRKGADMDGVMIDLPGVSVAELRRGIGEMDLRLFGKLEYAESRFSTVSAHFSGRVEKLWANYVGMPISKGDHLAELFSSELIVIQRELIMMRQAFERVGESGKAAALRNLESVKRKMSVWGLTSDQIARLENSDMPLERLTLYSPISGNLVERQISEGEYFRSGQALLSVADASELWLMLDVYESEISWVRYGQKVEFYVDAYPGERFSGSVVYIGQRVEKDSRTVKVRADVPNGSGKLRPGMFARAVLKVRLAADGVISETPLKGKWISPMHPDVVKDKPGTCDICGMALVPAESMGYFTSSGSADKPVLLVPASALLLSGRRAVVYVEVSPGHYAMRDIVPGVRAGDFYEVKEGLKEGDKVVVNGAFMIDSAMQLAGKPGMMSLSGGEARAVPEWLPPSMEHYFKIHAALAADDFKGARDAASGLAAISGNGDDEALTKVNAAALEIANSGDLETARKTFAKLSHLLYAQVKDYGVGGMMVYKFFCPMVDGDRGEFWMQGDGKLLNPYFGARMLHCGELSETIGKGSR